MSLHRNITYTKICVLWDITLGKNPEQRISRLHHDVSMKSRMAFLPIQIGIAEP